MTSFERRWAVTAVSAFAAAPGSPGVLAPARGEVDWAGTFGAMIRHGTRLSALGLRIAVWIATLAPLFLGFGFHTLGGLAPEQRAEVMDRLVTSKRYAVRELALLLKIVAAMALLGAPGVRARSGYDAAPPEPEVLEKRA